MVVEQNITLKTPVLVKSSIRDEVGKGQVWEEKNGKILIRLPHFAGCKRFIWFDKKTLKAIFSLETLTCHPIDHPG